MFNLKSLNSFLLLFLILFLVGCSSSNRSPVTPQGQFDLKVENLPVGVSDWNPDGIPTGGMGLMGLFNISIDPVNLKGDIEPLRINALTDVLEVVDITNFLRMAPCMNCVKIKSVALDSDSHVVVNIGIKHPFPEGDPFKPITGRNRADLHVFNVEGIVVSNAAGHSFPGINSVVSGLKLLNADGYTGYLDSSLDEIFPTDATIHPYILHFDDYSAGNFALDNPMGFMSVTEPPPTGNLVMAMGCDYNFHDYILDITENIEFIYAVGCTYALSAETQSQRFSPEYRIPQHNKKAASEVMVEITDNQLRGGIVASTANIEISVVDISHGVTVGSALNEMLSDSSVGSLIVDIPGVMTTPLTINGGSPVSGTGHSPADPLVYVGIVANTAGAEEGDYSGLVKVVDSYSPGQNSAPTLESMDGIKRVDPLLNPITGLFPILEFATYQAFTIAVGSGADPPNVLSIFPSSGILGSILDDVLITGSNFDNDAQVTLTKSTGGTPINATNEAVDPSGNSLTCSINLNPTDFTYGFYDVTVTNPSPNLSGTLTESFEVINDLTIQFQDTVQLYNHPTWDEFSPCIAQDATGKLIAFWHAHQPYPSIDIPGRSDDGVNWTGGSNVFGSTCTNCRLDVLKIAPRTTSGTFVLIHVTFASTMVYCATDYGAFSAPYVSGYPKLSSNLEMMVDTEGYGFGCGDLNGQIVFQKTPTPNVPDNSSTYAIAPGRLSHCRSWGCDSANLLYLAFLDTGATMIQMSHGTDDTNLTWTTPITIFQDAAYDDVRDPSMHLLNDVIHMSFLRHNISSGNYELCYTKADVSDLVFSPPVVVDTSTSAFEDAHIQARTYFSIPVVAIAYENGNTLFINYSTCFNGSAWRTPVLVQTAFSPTQDCDMIFLNHTGSLNEDLIVIWSEGASNRNIITRMAHFVQ